MNKLSARFFLTLLSKLWTKTTNTQGHVGKMSQCKLRWYHLLDWESAAIVEKLTKCTKVCAKALRAFCMFETTAFIEIEQTTREQHMDGLM